MMVRQQLMDSSCTRIAVLKSLIHDGTESWPWNFWKCITEHRNYEPTISLNCLIHSPNKLISWHFIPSLTTCIVKVYTSCFKVSAPLPHFAVTHESFPIHITHSSENISYIAPLHIKKSCSQYEHKNLQQSIGGIKNK